MVSVVSLSSHPPGGEVPAWYADIPKDLRTELLDLGAQFDALIAPLGRVGSRPEQRVLLDSLLEPFEIVMTKMVEAMVRSLDAATIKSMGLSTEYTDQFHKLTRDKQDLLGSSDVEKLHGAIDSFAGLQRYASGLVGDLLGDSVELRVQRIFEFELLNRVNRPIAKSLLLFNFIGEVLADRTTVWNPKSLHLAIVAADDHMTEVEDEFLAAMIEEGPDGPTEPADEALARLGL